MRSPSHQLAAGLQPRTPGQLYSCVPSDCYSTKAPKTDSTSG